MWPRAYASVIYASVIRLEMIGVRANETRSGDGDGDEDRPVRERGGLWRLADYRWWFAADTSGALSGSVIAFAMPMIVLAMTGSSLAALIVEAGCVVVQTLVGLIGGVVQDRYDRKALMMVWGLSGFVLYGVSAALIVVAIGSGSASDAARPLASAPWAVGAMILLVLLFSVRDGLLENTSNAMLRGVVPDADLPHAMAVNDARDSTVTLVGGPFGGMLMALGRAVPFVAGALLGAVGALSAWRIAHYWHRDPAATQSDSSDSSVPSKAGDDETGDARPRFRDAFGGLIWLLKDPFQRHLSIAAAAAAGAGNAILLLTTIEASQGGTRVISAGFVDAATSVGTLVGALVASRLIDSIRSGALVAAMFAMLAVGFLGAALAPSMPVKVAFVVCAVLAMPAGNAVLGGLSNLLVGKDKLGRIEAGGMLLQYGAYGLALAMSGVGMQWLGYRGTCLALAGVIAAAAVYALSMRALLTLPTPDHWGDHVKAWHIATF